MTQSGWLRTNLGSVVTFQRGYDITKKEQREGPYPVISSSGPTTKHDQFKAEGPGVVIGRKGSLGGVYYTEEPYWPHDTTLWVREFHGNNARFVYYFLQTLGLSHYDVGASNPTLNRNHIHLLPVCVPSRSSQDKIATILSAYDDLIENNTRRIKILEEMAQRIYREWFVEFRYPGHEGVLLVDSEIGPVPDGWETVSLGDLAEIDKGLSYKGEFLTGEGAPMANLKCFQPGGGFRRDGTKAYSGDYKLKHRVDPGTVIVANTDLTQAGNIIGSPGIIPRSGFERGGLISHHLFAVRPRDQRLGRAYLYYVLADDKFRDFARGRASGTTVLGFRTVDCADFRFALPTPMLREAFSTVVEAMLDEAQNLDEASDNLRITRDYLLPRLISGEIDVENLDIDISGLAA